MKRFVDFRFQENGKDVTAGIREKAKRVQTLLNSPDVLQKERSEARQIAQKLTSGYEKRFSPICSIGPASCLFLPPILDGTTGYDIANRIKTD